MSRERVAELVIEGCHDMADVYLEMAAEWSAVDQESWRDLYCSSLVGHGGSGDEALTGGSPE